MKVPSAGTGRLASVSCWTTGIKSEADSPGYWILRNIFLLQAQANGLLQMLYCREAPQIFRHISEFLSFFPVSDLPISLWLTLSIAHMLPVFKPGIGCDFLWYYHAIREAVRKALWQFCLSSSVCDHSKAQTRISVFLTIISRNKQCPLNTNPWIKGNCF